MKARFYLAMVAAALLMSNCSQDEPMAQSQGGTNTLTATIEGASRSAVTDAGLFSWTDGDAIAVGNENGGFTKFTHGTNGNFSAETSIVPTSYAIYPYNEAYTSLPETGLPTVALASSYDYGSTNAPMLAEIGSSNNLQFKHLGGIMRFVVKNVPNTVTSFTFTANSGITGDFNITENSEGEKIISSTGDNKTVTINFTSADINDVMTFYIPLPTGTYGGYTVSVGEKSHTTETSVVNTISRGTLLLMPTFTYDATTGLSKGTDGGVVTLEGGSQSLAVSGTQAVEVDANELAGAEAVLNLNYTPEDNSTLTLSESSDETESQEESAATVSVSVPTGTTVATLDITMPSMTVELNAAENETAIYTTVNALTAQNTLKIGEGVSVGTLNIKGGHIRLAGSITTVNRDDSNVDDVTYIILEDDVTAPTNLPEKVKVVNAAEWDLRKEIENAEAGSTVTLEKDVVLTNQLTIIKNLTLNLNGKTISNETDIWNPAEGVKAWSLVSVQGESVAVTIKGNGTLKAKENDCYAVDVRSGATVNIEGGEYVGNISAVYVLGGIANISGGTFSIQQLSEFDDYRYTLNCLDENYNAETASINVIGGTFNNFNPADNLAEGTETNFVKEGYTVSETTKDETIIYTVSESGN